MEPVLLVSRPMRARYLTIVGYIPVWSQPEQAAAAELYINVKVSVGCSLLQPAHRTTSHPYNTYSNQQVSHTTHSDQVISNTKLIILFTIDLEGLLNTSSLQPDYIGRLTQSFHFSQNV